MRIKRREREGLDCVIIHEFVYNCIISVKKRNAFKSCICSLLNMKVESSMKNWIEDELKKVEDTCLVKARNITGPYNREIALKKGYDGRQLLELLQNADDAAENSEHPSVLIRLEENRLVVANNGEPFSKSGVGSLIDSDNSPKKMSRRKIGCKGLGFRAVLNWSESIWIKSGGFSIEFSRENAMRFFRRLLSIKPSLGTEIQEQSEEKYDYMKKCPMATLSVPRWKDFQGFDSSEFDTYVVINFSSSDVKKDIQEQISGLVMEVALFLNNINTIILESPERRHTIEKVPSGSKGFKEIRIIDEHGTVLDSRRWKIFSKSDELPEGLRDEEKADQYEYELRIAVSEGVDDDVNRLFSYFKTEVKFPFPAIVHGTFELDDSRNHLVKSPINEFLLKELSSLMIETAKKLTQGRGNASWDAMRLLARRGEFDDKVEKMRFHENLLEAMKPQKLIPVLSNKYMSVDDGPVFYEAPFSEALKSASDVFPEMALYVEDKEIRELVGQLGVGKYDKAEYIERINKASNKLSMAERAELIVLIADKFKSVFYGTASSEMPRLFLDDEGRKISSKTQALLPPERTRFKLPENIRINFISGALFRLLRNRAGVRGARDLASRLRCFDVDEYRFDTVIRKIVAATNRLIREDVSGAREYTRNMLISLYQIYHDPEAAQQFPSIVTVHLFSRTGSLRSSRELYFGREYSAGSMIESLLTGIDESVFVPGRDLLGFTDEGESEVIDFLKWIGIEEYPRIMQKSLSGKDFVQEYEKYVLRYLPYPYTTDSDEVYIDYRTLERDRQRQVRSHISVSSINELDDILEKAEFEVVLAWLHCDHRLKQIIESGHEIKGSSFGIWFKNKQMTRVVSFKDIGSFILWKLRVSNWIRTKSGGKVRPDICCLSKNLTDMSPLIEIPAYDIRHSVFRENKVRQEDIEYILEKVGVARDFGKLSDETIYGILENLESADPEGTKAKNIYRQIIKNKEHPWAREMRNTATRKRFVEKGKLFSKHEGKFEYVPVQDAYYVDIATFCSQILERFRIAQIPKKSGKDKVRNIFGVSSMEDIAFSLSGSPEVHPLNKDFSKAFEAFKPYALVFRLEKPTLSGELNRLKRLKVVLCTRIPARYEFGDRKEELVLRPYEHIFISEGNTEYVLLEKGKHGNISDLKEDFDFREAFADVLSGILRVDENMKDYRELFHKSRKQKDQAIRSDLDDPMLDKLKKAREFFHGLSELESDFWESVLSAKGKPDILKPDEDKDEIIAVIARELELDSAFVKETYDSVNYEDYSSSANLPFFKRLFTAIGISVIDFNRNSSKEIDFSEYLGKEVENEKCRLRERFKSLAFSILKTKGLEEKESFVQILRAWDTPWRTDFDINKELAVDIDVCMGDLFKIATFLNLKVSYKDLLREIEEDPDGEFTKNKKAFDKRVEETGGGYADEIEYFLSDPKNRSLLYFGEIEELIERFSKKCSRPTGGGGVKKKKSITLNGTDVEYEEDDYKTLAENIDNDLKSNDYEFESHTPKKGVSRGGAGPGLGGGFGPRGRVTKQTKEIGFLGEKYVYGTLVKKYSRERVIWASEYAKIINVNPEGRDNIGYDIAYTDDDGKKHFVEVKATKNDDLAFFISKAEVRFGQKNRSDYDVILVLNVCGNNRRLLNLGKIFEFKEDETFNNNNKFIVDTESFRISFD